MQRVYDSWCEIMVLILHLRCILMGLERDYPVKVLSNPIKFYRPSSTYSSCFPQPKIKLRSRSFSTLKSPLDPNFITGFIDAEGSFVISIQKEPKNKTGWTIKSRLSISRGLRPHSSHLRWRPEFHKKDTLRRLTSA